MANETLNDLSSSSYLPSGLLEYVATWNNENIADTILAKRDVENKSIQGDQDDKTKLVSITNTVKEVGKDLSDAKNKNKAITSVEQPSFKLFGFEFAPIFIPIERRLQTAGAAIWISLFMVLPGLFLTFLIYCLFSVKYKWITLLYVAWCVYDWNTPYQGGRKNEAVKRWMRGSILWRYFAGYFPIKLVKTTDLDPNRSYLFGNHPHGILCAGAFASFGTDALGFKEKFPGLDPHLLTLQGQFWFFGYRELFLGSGACAATKEGMEYLLSKPKGHVSILIVGGALEALEGHRKEIRLVLNRRKGFIKLALRFGVDLVPTFSFGEQFIYEQADNAKGTKVRKFQEWAESWAGFAPAFFMGRGIFQYSLGIVPHRHPITVVTGAPLKVKKIDNPTREQIGELHEKYVEAVKNLYEEYNPIYGDTNIPLVIT